MRVILFCVLLLSVNIIKAQPAEPPYKRFPENIPLNLLLMDSTTHFTGSDLDARRQIMLMVFSPECDHCQRETDSLIARIDAFAGKQIVMASWLPFDEIKKFHTEKRLDRFPDIIVGRDEKFMLPPYYNISNLPFLAFYARKKKLISAADGSLGVPRILEVFNSAK